MDINEAVEMLTKFKNSSNPNEKEIKPTTSDFNRVEEKFTISL